MPESSIDTPVTTEYLGPEKDKFSGATKSSPKLNILTGNDAPWPGNSYIIGYQNTSKVLTYKDPKGVVLAEYEGKPTQRWSCHSRDGWLGLANDPGETTRWLGVASIDQTDPVLVCQATGINGSWETFCVMKRPEDGFLVFKRVKERLRPIGTGPDGNLSVRAYWNHWWGFTKVS
ncbi:uncharacterized protein DFL_002614 [Arthrobotrys flagrans]|uniref:Uncharacterized protein n=1 Tax=Arthrobotrys flagrans TaxID=97331 RepID=A0A437ABD1_ARTFL|nr:hypothetical protein DFL_002614 [Arthrobotrys flagrans]